MPPASKNLHRTDRSCRKPRTCQFDQKATFRRFKSCPRFKPGSRVQECPDSGLRDVLRAPRPTPAQGGILAAPDPLLEVRSPVLFHRSRRLRDRRHQWRWPEMLCAISRPIPQPNPCTTDRIRPAPCSGAKTAIAPTAKPARTIILTTMLLEIEAEETDRRGRRERAVRRRNSSAGLSRAGAARRSPQRPR